MPDSNIDLDLTFLNEIADGSDEFVIESIAAFLEQTPVILQETIDAINGDNWESTAKLLHSLKANLGFFGMLTSQALLIEMESKCKSADLIPADLKFKFQQMADIIGQSITRLEEIKADMEAGL